MLCNFCLNFDYDQLFYSSEGYKHHKNWNDLCSAGESGCDLCRVVLERVNNTKILPSWPYDEQIYCHFSWPTSMRWSTGGVLIARADVFTKASMLCNILK
jgi:hypothetical protein